MTIRVRDAVIVAASRSAVTRATKGAFASTRPDDLAAAVCAQLLSDCGNPQVDEVIVGCGYPWGEQGYNVARAITLLAGLPVSTAGATVTRLCASSLQALRMAHHAIVMGECESVLVAGVESFSRVGRDRHLAEPNPRLAADADLGIDYYLPMVETAERVARDYGVSREEMDRFAQRSQERAVSAYQSGFFGREIVPLTNAEGIVIDRDEGPRANSTLERLSQLEPVVGGRVTAGNACPLNDGAVALLVMSASAAAAHGARARARILGSSVAGVGPELMGIGPIPAVNRLLPRLGIAIADVDLVEINEAFAAQVIPSVRGFGMDSDDPRLNPRGGAIAIGHPFGMTGGRLVTTLINGLEQDDKTVGLVTLCVGGGQGQAMLIERIHS